MPASAKPSDDAVPVISLKDATGAGEAWGRSKLVVYVWVLFEWLFVTNSLQPSSKLRVAVLRMFGARIGSGVIFRPRTRVKFPWNLVIADDCWIGEGVWFHNQDKVTIGHDVVISQETMITTGSHAHRRDMSLITRPVLIERGTWVTSRCMVLGGARLGANCLVAPMSVVGGYVESGSVVRGNPAQRVGPRNVGDVA